MQKENLKKEEQKGISLETKKEIAKIGMTASLGAVVLTSFSMRSKLSKRVHIGAGAALVGFSLWHHLLYQPEKKDAKEKTKKAPRKKSTTTVVNKDNKE